jgi:excisionase family DNA binding protein
MDGESNGSGNTHRLLLTVDEAADRLGLGRTKVYDLLRRGQLTSVRIGTARRVPAVALEEYVERLLNEQGAGFS